jgi:hypothetical protein
MLSTSLVGFLYAGGMKNLDDLLRQNREDLTAQLANGLPKTKEEILAALATMTEMHRCELELVTPYARDLVKAALALGVPQDDLRGLPYHETQVRRLARETGLEPRTGGRPKLPTAEPAVA